MKENRERNSEGKKILGSAIKQLLVPTQMGFSLMIFVLIGYYLDEKTGRSPMFTLIFLVAGLISVFLQGYRLYKETMK